MFAGSLVLGVTLIVFAAWLQWNETVAWTDERLESRLDAEYLIRRTRLRSRIHLIIGGCGLTILVAAFAGPGTQLWVTAWLTVILALVVIILLAILDAWRTYRYHLAKRPEAYRNVNSRSEPGQ